MELEQQSVRSNEWELYQKNGKYPRLHYFSPLIAQSLFSASIMQRIHRPKKLKIVLLGNRAVGKSSIIRRYVLDEFPQDIQPTVGVDYMSKTITCRGNQYRVQLWDTAGQEKYRSLVKGYLKGAHACIYVYDYKSFMFLNPDLNSYMDLISWINLFESSNSQKHASLIAGNKWDLCTQQDLQAISKAKSLINKNQPKINEIEQMRCSAKTSQNINQILMRTVEKIIDLDVFTYKRSSTQIYGSNESYLGIKCCQS